jgi:colanic acid biosynthesis glycosyl transferase WcaI
MSPLATDPTHREPTPEPFDIVSDLLLLSDYARHPFTTELAVALTARGEAVTYTYCAAAVSPKGRIHPDLDVIAVSEGLRFEKYRPLPRLWSEIRYGAALARIVWRTRPGTHVVCNMPLVSAAIVWLFSLPLRVPLIIWFQDVQSGLAAQSLGPWPRRALSALETFVLRRAARVIAISPELAEEAERRGVASDRIGVLENWAPVEHFPVTDSETKWADDIGLTARPLFVYSGTLARKHDPSLLIDLAASIESLGGHLLVVTEGEGAEYISSTMLRTDAPHNITVLPYQPFDRLPEMLAAADVLVVILEPEAGPFSVPSKTLSYLCAGRAVLGSMPATNPATRSLTERALAGLVAEPHDREAFCALAARLASDETNAVDSENRDDSSPRFTSPRMSSCRTVPLADP